MDDMKSETPGNPELEEITNQIDNGIKKGRFKMAELQSKLVDKTKRAATSVDYYVHDNAWKVVGAAAAIGFIAGWLMHPQGSKMMMTRKPWARRLGYYDWIRDGVPLILLGIKGIQSLRSSKTNMSKAA